MGSIGLEPFATTIPMVHFALLAHAMGARGLVVRRDEELDAAMLDAMQHPGPVVVDVRVDPTIAPSFGPRNARIRDAAASKWRTQE